MKLVYLDNAASTKPCADALSEAARAAEHVYANPSSVHAPGAAAARDLQQARATLATHLDVAARDVVFTSGGTEANALGILGAARRARGRHAVISAIEHPSVLRNAAALRDLGFEVTEIPCGPSGRTDPGALVEAVRDDTAVVALMLVNNELGTLQPVSEVARALVARRGSGAGTAVRRPRPPHLHCDAVQALGFLPVRPRALGVDTLALSAHKVHGPKGVGALWVSPTAQIAPLWDGGRQENGVRSGTENLPGIVAFAAAVRCVATAFDAGGARRVAALRDRFEGAVQAAITGARPTVAATPERAPHISSLAFPNLPAEPLLHALGARGVIAAAGSACASRTRGPSHVLRALGIDDRTAVLRFSLSRDTTEDELSEAVQALASAVQEVAPMARPPRTG